MTSLRANVVQPRTRDKMEKSIEQKEIRGISLRNLITLIACTITICTTVMGTYFSLTTNQNNIQKALDEVKLQKQNDEKYTDLRLRTMEIRIDNLELQNKEIISKYEEILRK